MSFEIIQGYDHMRDYAKSISSLLKIIKKPTHIPVFQNSRH